MDSLLDLLSMMASTMAILLSLSFNLAAIYILWRLCRSFADYLFPFHRFPSLAPNNSTGSGTGDTKPATSDANTKAPVENASLAEGLWYTGLVTALIIAGGVYLVTILEAVQKGGAVFETCTATTAKLLGVMVGVAASVIITAMVVKGLVLLA